MAKALVLTSISGARIGVRYTLSARSNVIGSAQDCAMSVNDRSVDARHAEVKQQLDSWFIVPLSPRGGVYVNGEPVRGQGRLRPGDSVIIGSCGFSVSIEEVETRERSVGQNQNASATVPRLGDYLIRQGLLTRSQIEHAVRRQEDLTSQGKRVPLGDVLVQLGYIRSSVLESVLREQQSDINWRD